MTDNNRLTVPIKDKYAMSITEASIYFGLGERKLRQIVNENKDAKFILQNGVKYLIKRRQFEQYLESRTSV